MIIVWLFLIIIIIAIFFSQSRLRGTQLLSKQRNRFLPKKTGLWLLLGYSAVLIVGLLIVTIIPAKLTVTDVDTNTDKVIAAEQAAIGLSSFDQPGVLDKIKSLQVKKRWKFDYNADQLELIMGDKDTIPIIAERKDTNDNKIEVIQYTTGTFLGNVDVTDQINPQIVTLKDKTMSVNDPSQPLIKIARLNPDFTITQFTRQNELGSDFSQGPDILYLRIPKELDLTGDTDSIRIL